MSDEIIVYEEGEEGEEVVVEVGVVISDEKELKEIAQKLCTDYQAARAGREEKEQTWAKWRRQYEARPNRKSKDYPYPNASNVVPPLSQIVGQALFGHLKEMYDQIDPPWYVKPLREGDQELIKQAEVLTKYYNLLSKSRLDLNFDSFKRDFLHEVAVMGTCYVKVPWTTTHWHFKGDEAGLEADVDALLHDGPELMVIPVEDLVYPENWKDIQKMPWIAHDVQRARYELEDLAARGVYEQEAVDAMLQYAEHGSGTTRNQVREEISQVSPDREDEFLLTEFYFYYDADKDGRHEDLVFTVHVPSGIVLRQSYNEFGYRMITSGTFISRSFMLEGRGAGQTTEYQQDEIEGIHNVRNDNMKFANMRVLAARKGAFRENEQIFPGKIFLTDNPREDLVPIQLGEVYPSSLQAENMTMNYAREASGMSSIMAGFSDQRLGSRDTASGQSMRMSRGQGLFATIAEGLNECFSEIGMMMFFQLVKNRDRVLQNERDAERMNPEELVVLGETLGMELRDVPIKLSFQIRTSDIDQTFEAKRQNMLSLTQLFSQFAMQTTPLAMQLFGPEGQQIQQAAPDAYAHMLSIYTGSTRLMSEVFKFFGEEDPQRYVPDVRKFELMQDMMREMNTQLVESAGRMQQGQAPAGPEPIGIEEAGIEEGMTEEQAMMMAQEQQGGMPGGGMM